MKKELVHNHVGNYNDGEEYCKEPPDKFGISRTGLESKEAVYKGRGEEMH